MAGFPTGQLSPGFVTTPKGVRLELEIEDIQMGENWVSCAVRKDGGDDPDVTNGMLVYSRAA